jgi:hypothetical protein
MWDDAKRFRARAIDCRALAKSASNQIDAAMLEDIAAELDAEARRIEAEDAAGGRERPSAQS